jgi:hypothetical protein
MSGFTTVPPAYVSPARAPETHSISSAVSERASRGAKMRDLLLAAFSEALLAAPYMLSSVKKLA